VRAAWCASIWTGDGPGSIDPQKEVDAAQKRVDLGISTKQAESIAYDGVDWNVKHEQRVKEINAEKRDGIYVPPAGSPAKPNDTVPTEDGLPVKNPRGDSLAAQEQSFADINARLDALAKQPQTITINTPPVTVNQGDTHHHIAGPTVEGHEISVNLPEGCIQLEATVQAAQVHVDVPAPQVIVQQAPKQSMHQIHKRDDDGNLTETLTTYKV